MRLADGVLLVVDSAEGVTLGTEKIIAHAARNDLPVILVLSKLDRLITELKIPPNDAYYKLSHIIDRVNELILQSAPSSPLSPSTTAERGGGGTHHTTTGSSSSASYPHLPRGPTRLVPVSPEKGSVLFGSGLWGIFFSLRSFAQITLSASSFSSSSRRRTASSHDNTNNNNNNNNNNTPTMTAAQFAKRLWGDTYLDPTSRKFVRTRPPATHRHPETERTFVEFVLNPIYKLTSAVVGEDAATLEATLAALGLAHGLRPSELHASSRPLLRKVMRALIPEATGLVEACVEHIPSAKKGTGDKVEMCYSGPRGAELRGVMAECRGDRPLVVQVRERERESERESEREIYTQRERER